MLALENLGRRISEDRPQIKFARNPSYGDDVKWLLSISKKLGQSPHKHFPPSAGISDKSEVDYLTKTVKKLFFFSRSSSRSEFSRQRLENRRVAFPAAGDGFRTKLVRMKVVRTKVVQTKVVQTLN
jgi:hypothetical protein